MEQNLAENLSNLMNYQNYVSPLRRTIRPHTSEGRASRKILINPEEEDEAP